MKRFLIAAVSSIALLGATASINTASAGNSDPFALLFGAAAGGFIGSHIGSGDGRVVATAAGTLLGAAIAHNATRGHSTYTTSRTRTVYRPNPYASTYYAPPVPRRANVYIDNRTYISQTNTTVTHRDRDRDNDRRRGRGGRSHYRSSHSHYWHD